MNADKFMAVFHLVSSIILLALSVLLIVCGLHPFTGMFVVGATMFIISTYIFVLDVKKVIQRFKSPSQP